jgi:ABC-2 type transport system permease protein
MLAAFRGELFKLVRRPAVWVCTIGLLALAVTLGYGIPWLIETFPPPGSSQSLPAGTSLADLKVALYPPNFVREVLGQWGVLGGVFALILGVLVQGSEYGWSTIKTLYVQRHGRLSMLAGKIAALAVVVLVMVLGLFAVSAAASLAVALIEGKDTAFPAADVILKGVAALYLIFGFWGMFGLWLATLFRQSAMAIGLGLAYALVIEGIVFGILGALGGNTVKQIQQWFPIANTGYLTSSFGEAQIRGIQRSAASIADATHAVVVLFAYLAAFIAITAYLSRRRDITN